MTERKMVKKSDWYERGTDLMRRLDAVRPREHAAVLQDFSAETNIAVSYARRIVSACRAVHELAETDQATAAGLYVANVQAVAAIWRWLAYDKKGAIRAARELANAETTVRAIEEEEQVMRRIFKQGMSGTETRKRFEARPTQRRSSYAESAFVAAQQLVGSARHEWTRPGLMPGHSGAKKLPFALAWLSGLAFGHFVFIADEGHHIICHIFWPRQLARREHVRSTVLMALGLSDLGFRVGVISSDETEVTEANAMLKQRVSSGGGRVQIVQMPAHE